MQGNDRSFTWTNGTEKSQKSRKTPNPRYNGIVKIFVEWKFQFSTRGFKMVQVLLHWLRGISESVLQRYTAFNLWLRITRVLLFFIWKLTAELCDVFPRQSRLYFFTVTSVKISERWKQGQFSILLVNIYLQKVKTKKRLHSISCQKNKKFSIIPDKLVRQKTCHSSLNITKI